MRLFKEGVFRNFRSDSTRIEAHPNRVRHTAETHRAKTNVQVFDVCVDKQKFPSALLDALLSHQDLDRRISFAKSWFAKDNAVANVIMMSKGLFRRLRVRTKPELKTWYVDSWLRLAFIRAKDFRRKLGLLMEKSPDRAAVQHTSPNTPHAPCNVQPFSANAFWFQKALVPTDWIRLFLFQAIWITKSTIILCEFGRLRTTSQDRRVKARFRLQVPDSLIANGLSNASNTSRQGEGKQEVAALFLVAWSSLTSSSHPSWATRDVLFSQIYNQSDLQAWGDRDSGSVSG